MNDDIPSSREPASPDRGEEQAPAPQTPRPLRPGWTIASALVLLPVLAVLLWPASLDVRLASVSAPAEAVERIVGRTMELHEAVGRREPWEQRLYVLLGLIDTEDVDLALRWYDELEDRMDDPELELRAAILEAETGHLERFTARMASWAEREDLVPRLAGVLRQIYLGEAREEIDARALLTIYAWLDDGWFRDRLDVARGRAVGDMAVADFATARLADRSTAILMRARLLMTVLATVLVTGAFAFAVAARHRGQSAVIIGTAPIPPPWPGRRGLAIMLRAAALSALIGAAVLLLPGDGDLLRGIELLLGVLIALPLLVLGHRYLLQPSGLRLADGLGLRLVPGGGARLVLAVPAVMTLGLAGDGVIGSLGAVLGRTTHWTEWFDESLVFGGPAAVATVLVGAVVLAPLTEEIAFRGFLFAALRRRCAWPVAAALSAMAFALLHGYGVLGFLSVAWSGWVWAWAYERTRSLWPGILAHAAGNLFAALLVLGLLR